MKQRRKQEGMIWREGLALPYNSPSVLVEAIRRPFGDHDTRNDEVE
jgi:hypothetical protein